MSVQAITWAKKQTCGGSSGKVILQSLADYANSQGQCWPAENRLAQETELDPKTVRTWTRRLAEKGLIKIQKRRDENGRKQSPIYTLLMDGAAVSITVDADENGQELPPGNSPGGADSHRELTDDQPGATPDRTVIEPSDTPHRSPQGDTPAAQFSKFEKTWDWNPVERRDTAERAFLRMAPSDRLTAIDAVKRYQAETRRQNRTQHAASTYLQSGLWRNLPSRKDAADKSGRVWIGLDNPHWPALRERMRREVNPLWSDSAARTCNPPGWGFPWDWPETQTAVEAARADKASADDKRSVA